MNKKTFLCTTIASTMLIAGITFPMSNAAAENLLKHSFNKVDSKNIVTIELDKSNDQLSRQNIRDLFAQNEHFMIKEIKNIKGETDENATVGTGSTVTLETDETFTIELFGDVDGNGKITSNDAQIAFEKAFNGEADDLRCADISGTSGVTSGDAQAIFDLAFANEGKSGYVAEGKMPEENYEVSTHIVNLVDTKHNTTTKVETNAEGKIIKENIQPIENFTDSTNKITYRLYGWAKTADAKEADIINLDEEDLSEVSNLYAVWTPYAKAIVKLHYDGEKMPNPEATNGENVNKVIDLSEKLGVENILAGQTINLNDERIEEAKHESDNGHVTYTQSGWYAKTDATNTLLTSTYQIPVATNNNDITVDLYPAWDISATKDSNSETIDQTKISGIITELTTLQTANSGYCGNIAINSKAQINSSLSITDGVTVTFNEDVTVGESGKITGKAVKGNKDVSIVKLIGSSATDLSEALNTEVYDTVKLNDTVSDCSSDITIEAGSAATLDLNGKNLTINDSNKLTINGKEEEKAAGSLTIVNHDDAATKIEAKKGIVNSGNLTIGEPTAEEATANTITITSKTTSDTNDGAVITNKKDATLTVKAGNIIGASTQTTIPAGSIGVVTNEQGGTVVIEGGKIDAKTKECRIPALLNEGKATISGGELCRSTNSTDIGNGYYVVVNHGNMEINDGIFQELSKANTLSATSALIENGYQKANEAVDKESVLDIYGGTFNGGRYVVASDYAGVTTVKGGNFTAKAQTTADTTAASKIKDQTRGIFKCVGVLNIDFRGKTAEECSIDLGTGKTNTKLVLIGDQNITEEQSKLYDTHKASLNIHPFDPALVTINKEVQDSYDEVAKKIIVEKSTDSKLTKSEVIAYVEDTNAIKAGEQLMAIIKNSVAKQMDGKDANKNTVKIILGSNVEIPKTLDTDPNYNPTQDNTTLDLQGNTLTIHQLAVFKKNVTVEDTSTDKSGKIVLDSNKTTNGPVTIFEKGKYAEGVNLSDLANQEVDKD